MKARIELSYTEAAELVRRHTGIKLPAEDVTVVIPQPMPPTGRGKIAAIKILRDAINRRVGTITPREPNDNVSTTGFYIGLADAKTLVEQIMAVL